MSLSVKLPFFRDLLAHEKELITRVYLQIQTTKVVIRFVYWDTDFFTDCVSYPLSYTIRKLPTLL